MFAYELFEVGVVEEFECRVHTQVYGDDRDMTDLAWAYDTKHRTRSFIVCADCHGDANRKVLAHYSQSAGEGLVSYHVDYTRPIGMVLDRSDRF